MSRKQGKGELWMSETYQEAAWKVIREVEKAVVGKEQIRLLRAQDSAATYLCAVA